MSDTEEVERGHINASSVAQPGAMSFCTLVFYEVGFGSVDAKVLASKHDLPTAEIGSNPPDQSKGAVPSKTCWLQLQG